MKNETITSLEVKVATLFANTSTDICGEFNEDNNLSYMNARDIADETGMSLQAVGGVMASLSNKSIIVDTEESTRGVSINDFIGSPEVFTDYDELKHLAT